MQHGEKELVYCIETIKSDGGRQCFGAKKRNEREGRGMFSSVPTGVDTKRQNAVRGREGAMSIQAGRLYTLDKQRREARK